MKKTNSQKGITLIALIITVIVLLILAGAAVSIAVNDSDLFNKTVTAKGKWNKEVEQETVTTSEYLALLDQYGGIGNKITVAEAQSAGTIFDKNTILKDEYNNKVVVPKGFKIASGESGSAINVTEGIVIEDATYSETIGNQFVWIPVGKIYTDENSTEENAITIELGRYSFENDGTPSPYTGPSVEEDSTKTSELLNHGNTIAKDIYSDCGFIKSVERYGGYYIGRYKARAGIHEDHNLKVLITDSVQNYDTENQLRAAEYSRRLYSSVNFTSDLMNSYAYDTALLFLQTFDNRTEEAKSDPKYNAVFTQQESFNTAAEMTICNVHDLVDYTPEWLTETHVNIYNNYKSFRGGIGFKLGNRYGTDGDDPPYFARNSHSAAYRPIIYINTSPVEVADMNNIFTYRILNQSIGNSDENYKSLGKIADTSDGILIGDNESTIGTAMITGINYDYVFKFIPKNYSYPYTTGNGSFGAVANLYEEAMRSFAQRIEIPSSVKLNLNGECDNNGKSYRIVSIGDNAFCSKESLNPTDNFCYTLGEISKIVIPNSITNIGKNAFAGPHKGRNEITMQCEYLGTIEEWKSINIQGLTEDNQNTIICTDGEYIERRSNNNNNNGNYGDDGSYGDYGDDGSYGNNGDDGSYGNYGDDGSYGNYGDDGSYGNNGDDGSYGDYGDNGSYGDYGDDGSYGDYGDYNN